MGLTVRKPVFSGLQIIKAQTILLICAFIVPRKPWGQGVSCRGPNVHVHEKSIDANLQFDGNSSRWSWRIILYLPTRVDGRLRPRPTCFNLYNTCIICRYETIFLHRYIYIRIKVAFLTHCQMNEIRRITCCLNMYLNLKILKMSAKLFTWLSLYIQEALWTRLTFRRCFC